MASAWLFDVYPHPTRSELVVWIKHGARMEKRYVPYQPDFCVRAETMPLEEAERLLANDPRVERTWRAKARLWLRGPEEDVLRVRPKRLQDVHRVATDLRRATRSKGFLFFDVDHQSESRWMHSKGLFAMCRLRVERGLARLERAPDEDRWSIDYPYPAIRDVRLEVTARRRGHERSWDDPLESIKFGPTEIACDPADDQGERKALLELARLLRRHDPDVIVTHHGDRWDIPYLLRRIRYHKLEREVQLGRETDPDPERPDQEAKSIHTYGRWLFKTHAYYLRGRWHIDLSKKTLDSEDDRKDLHGILYLARVSNRRPQDVNRNGAGYALQQMQIDAAADLGVALPWKRNLAEDWKDAATLCAVDRGGQIMVPTPGLYEDVAACDFSGYYPSLVVAHNLSSDSLNCACCPDGPLIPELGYHRCVKIKGHQASVLERIAPHRRYAKAILRRAETSGDVDPDLVAKCRAIKSEQKALGVVCFGYFRYRNARFGCAEVHQSIQCLGRDGMTRARQVAQRLGFTMVHAMTDCTFLQKPGVTRAEARHLARRIAKEVGVPMDVEGVYKWIVFLPSKTHSSASDVGVPNRYYGLFEDGRLKVRGIDVQRHITPAWIYDAQQGMLDVLSRARDASGFRRLIPEALAVAQRAADRLRRREVDPKDLGLLVQTRMEAHEYRANTATKAALLRLQEAGTRRRPGEYVQYVIARRKGPLRARALPTELLGKGSRWFGSDGSVHHEEAYLRLLARSVETLLSTFGLEEENVLRWLRGAAPDPWRATQRSLPRRPSLAYRRR